MTASLVVQARRHFLEPRLPHGIYLDGHLVCMMQRDMVRLQLPAGTYDLRIQFGGPITLPLIKRLFHSDRQLDLSVSSTTQLTLKPQSETRLVFRDRERLWNLLFDIDLVASIVTLFVATPPLYKIISNAFFALWLVRLVVIRKRYYHFSITTTD